MYELHTQLPDSCWLDFPEETDLEFLEEPEVFELLESLYLTGEDE